MIELIYTNTENDLLTYYEFLMQSNPATAKQRIAVAIMGPGAVLILLAGIRPKVWWAYVIAVLFSLLWVLFFSKIMYNDVVRTATKRKLKSQSLKLDEIHFKYDGGKFYYKDKEVHVKNYYGYLNLFIVVLDNQENIIVPERVFGKDKEQEKEFITAVAKAVHEDTK